MFFHTLVLTVLATAAVPGPTPAPLGDCRAVAGNIQATAGRIALGWRGLEARGDGTMSGGLAGPLDARIRPGRSDGPGRAFSVIVSVDSGEGPLGLEGVATTLPDEKGPVRTLEGWLDVSTPDGNRWGRIQLTGSVVMSSRELALEYAGRLCPPDAQVATAERGGQP